MSHTGLSLKEFCAIVDQVMRELPEPFQGYLDNVVVDVEMRPSKRALRRMGMEAGEWDQLMGLFQGRALPHQEYGERHPNRITLYKKSIEAASRSRAEIEYEIRRTLMHELAHHFGFDEDHLEKFESTPSPFEGDEATEEL